MTNKNLTALIITNNWANKAKKNGKYEEKTIKIQGDCFITNYNVYESSGNSKGLVSVSVNNGNANIEYGNGTGKESSQVLNLSQEKYSIFLTLANLSILLVSGKYLFDIALPPQAITDAHSSMLSILNMQGFSLK